MSKQQATNTWKDGLNKDLNPMVTPNTMLTDNLNGTLITYNGNEFSLQNDMGNVNVGPISEGFYPIGMTEHGGILYITSIKEGQFYRYFLTLPSTEQTPEVIEDIIERLKSSYPYFGFKELSDLIYWDDDSSDQEESNGWLCFFPEKHNLIINELSDIAEDYDGDYSFKEEENKAFEVGSYPSLPREYEEQPVELEKEYPFENTYRPLYNLYDNVDFVSTREEERVEITGYDKNYYVCVKINDDSEKLLAIHEIKDITDLGLKECKTMVEAGNCLIGPLEDGYYEYVPGQKYGLCLSKYQADALIETINNATLMYCERAFGVVESIPIYDKVTVEVRYLETREILFNFTTDLLPKYNRQHPVTIETQPSYDGSVNLILNDNNDVPRLINTGFAVTGDGYGKFIEKHFQSEGYYYEDIEKSTRLINQNFKFPSIWLDRVSNENGNLAGGNYVFYIKLSDYDGNLTDIVCESGIISVFIGDSNSIPSIQGAFHNENARKSISVTLNDLDTVYNKIHVYYTREYCDQNGYRLVEAKHIKNPFDLTSNSQSLTITGYEETEDISIEELNIYFHNISKSKAITQQSNMLFLGNVSTSKLNYETLALLSYQIEVSTAQEQNIGWINPKTYDSNIGAEYYDVQNIYNYLGYWPNEFYRFGIVYLLQDGSHTNVLDLKGCEFSSVGEKNTDSPHQGVTLADFNNILLNDVSLDNTRGVFRTPNQSIFVENNSVLPICFKFSIPIDVQVELSKLNIIGYQIVRQKRIPSILCQGYSVGINKGSYYPMIKPGNNYIAESFVEYDSDAEDKDTYLLRYSPQIVTTEYAKYVVSTDWYLYEPKFGNHWITGTYKGKTFWVNYPGNYIFLMGSYYDGVNPDPGYAPWAYDWPYQHYNEDRVEKIVFYGFHQGISDTMLANLILIYAGNNNGFFYLNDGDWKLGFPDDWDYFDVQNAMLELVRSCRFTTKGEAIDSCINYAATHEKVVSPYTLNRWNVNSESYLRSIEHDDSSDDYGDLPFTFRSVSPDLVSKKSFGLLSVEANITPELQSALNGSEYQIVKNYNCSNIEHRLIVFDVNNYKQTLLDTRNANCLFIPSNTVLKYISSEGVGFSTKIGDASDVSGFKKLTGGEPSPKLDHDPDVIRGLFTPYIGCYGIDENAYEENTLYNICIPINTIDFVLSIGNNNVEYFSASNKIPISSNTTAYRGDCYTNTVTVRMHSNFIDPTAPVADKIVDETAWQKNYHGINPTDEAYKKWREDLNLGDLNTVTLGHWITFKCLSSINLGLRSEDTSNVSEYANMGNPRSFYPHIAASTTTSMKVPDTTLFNHGYDATVSRIRYSLKEKTPYDKNEFGTRVMFSNVAITDSFQNGYRTFQGASYKDYPTTYGDIIKLLPWGQNLFCVFEHGISIIPVNQKALMNTTTEDTIHIYGYGVLPEDLSVISQDFGSIWADSVIRTPLGIYGVDTSAKKIWQYTDAKGLVTISDMKIQRFLNDEINLGLKSQEYLGVTNVKTHYNMYKGDVMFTFYNTDDNGVKKEWNICYNERQGIWVTRYSWIPLLSANADNTFYSIELHKWLDSDKNAEENRPFGIWKHGRTGVDRLILPTHWYNIQEPFEFEFVAGEPMGIDKIFENLKITSNNVQPESFDFQIIGDDYLFNRARIYHELEAQGKLDVYGESAEDIAYAPQLGDPTEQFTKQEYQDSPKDESWDPIFYNARLTYDRVLDEYELVVSQPCRNKEVYGIRRGNIQYRDNAWYTDIEPLRYNPKLKNPNTIIADLDDEDPNKFISAKLRDKWMKVKIKYKGDRLAIIGAVTTTENISYV